MIGNRPSSLPMARYCGLAPKLGAQHGAGESARLSSAFHAKCADALAPGQWEALTDEEQKEVSTWHVPSDVQPPKGPLLTYAESFKELELGLTEDFGPCAKEDPNALIGGSLDFCWLVVAKNGLRVVFVADIKRRRWTATDGPESLQLLAYAWMAAAHFNADAYCTGIWIAEEGEWMWSDRVMLVDSPEAIRQLEEVEAACRNTGDAITGSHCQGCYSRLYCPEYTSPPSEGLLSPALNQSLTDDNALAALNEAERLEKLAKAAKDNIKAAVLQGKLKLRSEDGKKVYRAAFRKGREGFNQRLARKELGEAEFERCVTRFVTRGEEYTEFRWVKA